MQANRLYAALVAALVPATALATNGDQMTALSAPQAGMGGATTAFAQDALTVLVNPAGMADLGMKDVRLDFGFGLLNPPRKVNGNESDSNWYMMPTGAVAFNVNDKLFLGMGMGGVSGMGVNVPDINLPAPGNQPMVTTKQVFRFSPAAAYRVNDALTLGASLNIGYQSLALSNTNFSLPQNQQFGFGATLGATYKISPKLQAGLAWTSKTDISDMEYHTTAGKVSFDMDMPSSLAFGLAFRPMPGLLVEADIKRYNFSDVMDRIPVKGPGAPYPSVLTFGWDDQTVYAVGVKKDMGPMSFRIGFNYGKSPIGPEDVNSNLGSTAVVEKHLSFGVTRKFSDKVHGNFAYTHAFHNKVNSNTTPNSIEMYQNQYNLNVTYVF
ncbi:MAG: OmpP1/FadL family transporter [Thiobacillus sp.]